MDKEVEPTQDSSVLEHRGLQTDYQGIDQDELHEGSKPLPWRWEEDGLTVTRTAAWSGPGCHNGCGVLMYTNEEGKLVKVEGDPENPFNMGRICVRCLTHVESTYHKDRLLYPLKRIGERGENKWERISWDEALDTIAEKFLSIREKYGAESVVFAQGTGRDIASYITRLAWSFGSPNYVIFLAGFACYGPRIATSFLSQGFYAEPDFSEFSPYRFKDPNWVNPECIVVWGVDPLKSNADGFFGHWIVDSLKRGSKLIVIDPRLTWLAARAEVFLPIRPGTDAALALGILNIAIQEDLYDHNFVEKWTYGIEQLAERAAEYPVEKVSAITGIPEGRILEAARLWMAAKPTAVKWGLAVDMTKESIPASHAIASIWAIAGSVDMPGGMIPVRAPFNVMSNNGWGAEFISDEQMAKKLGTTEYPFYTAGSVMAHPDTVMNTLLTGKPYELKAGWFQTTNPIACAAAEPRKLLEALRQFEFCVVADVFMTPTAVAVADIVLPVCTSPERDGLRAQWFYVQPINKVTEPLGESKSDMEICAALGRRLNPEAWPWETTDEMFTDLLKQSGMTIGQLREYGGMLYPKQDYYRYQTGGLRPDGQPGFATPTGRLELYATLFERFGFDPLPFFEEPPDSPVSTPERYKDYPLILTTGARSYFSFHSEHRQIPTLRSMRQDPTVEIHPKTAAEFGVHDGDWVWIENQRGRARRKIKETNIIRPDVINADHGWWQPEAEAAEPILFNVWDLNINNLVPWDCGKTGFGSPYKA
jgi:anaerobic selenocysteine-containing dehydrogenase